MTFNRLIEKITYLLKWTFMQIQMTGNKKQRGWGSRGKETLMDRERERAIWVSAPRKRKLWWLTELLKPEILVWLLLLVTTDTGLVGGCVCVRGGGTTKDLPGEDGVVGSCQRHKATALSTSVAFWVFESLESAYSFTCQVTLISQLVLILLGTIDSNVSKFHCDSNCDLGVSLIISLQPERTAKFIQQLIINNNKCNYNNYSLSSVDDNFTNQ